MEPLRRISYVALVTVIVSSALIAGVSTYLFYGFFPNIKSSFSIMFFLIAAVCAVLGWVIRRRISEANIGMDRSQLHPIIVARCVALGQAVAWIGAGFLGIYGGIAVYVAPRAGDVLAAASDLPGVLVGGSASLLSMVAGVWLEHSCEAPPEDFSPATDL